RHVPVGPDPLDLNQRSGWPPADPASEVPHVSEFIVIAGLSGGGRSQAADILEDLGWFVIDNMPPALIPKVSELAQAPGDAVNHVALVVGTGRYHDEVLPALAAL